MIKNIIVFLSINYIYCKESRNDNPKEPEMIYNPSLPVSGNFIVLSLDSPHLYQALEVIDEFIHQNYPSTDYDFRSIGHVDLRVIDEPDLPIRNIFRFTELTISFSDDSPIAMIECNGSVVLEYDSDEQLTNSSIRFLCLASRNRNSSTISSCLSRAPLPYSRNGSNKK